MNEKPAQSCFAVADDSSETAEAAYLAGALRDATGPTIRPGGLELTNRGVEFCGLSRGARVLDVGCGPGASVSHLRNVHGLRALGIDRSGALLAQGLSRGNPACRAEASELPFPDACTDAVLCECVLSLVTDPNRALREFFRVLVPGGHLILTDMYVRGEAESASLGKLPVESCLRGAERREAVEDRVRAAGFTPVVWEDHTSYLRELLVRLIFSGGSSSISCVSGRSAADLARVKPGYYLLIAEK